MIAPWRHRLHEVIFEADTPAGRAFDVALLALILLSVAAVVLESVASIRVRYGTPLRIVEWLFTVVFTVEYVLRLLSVRRPMSYARSFYGVVDLVAILPTYLSLVLEGSQALLVLRALRLLRIFRVFKLARYVSELSVLTRAVRRTSAKITVFLFSILTIALIMGTLMYVVEGEQHGFTSIPRAVYWAIVTITTVGYGDIAPRTIVGQMVAAFAMVLGYSLIIIPTGIFSAEILQANRSEVSNRACPHCSREGQALDAVYCKFCGGRLEQDEPAPPRRRRGLRRRRAAPEQDPAEGAVPRGDGPSDQNGL